MTKKEYKNSIDGTNRLFEILANHFSGKDFPTILMELINVVVTFLRVCAEQTHVSNDAIVRMFVKGLLDINKACDTSEEDYQEEELAN